MTRRANLQIRAGTAGQSRWDKLMSVNQIATLPAELPVDLPAERAPGRIRRLWDRVRLTVGEMNYATRRLRELQAPWIG